jgi:hypothetical protein
MSELGELNLQEIRGPKPDDGAEVLQNAQRTFRKGVTRRRFLRLASATAVGWFLSSCAPEQLTEGLTSSTNTPAPTETTTPIEQYLQPELVHGVKVFGLKEPIATDDQIDRLYQSFDRDFDEKVPDNLKDASRWEQREAVLPKDKRFGEFVVTQSAYEGWEGEHGVDYITWVKLHIDLLNSAIQNAEPYTQLTVDVLRVVVVQDNIANNPSRYSKDLDGSWFNESSIINSSYMYDYKVQPDGSVIFEPEYPTQHSQVVELSIPSDSFRDHPQGRVDCGTTHELSHQILNLPDEYTYDYHNNSNRRFPNFFFDTGSFHNPIMSSHLGYVLKYNHERNIRGYYTDPGGIGNGWEVAINAGDKALSYTLHPNSIKFELVLPEDENFEGAEVFVARLEGDYYSKRSFPDIPDKTAQHRTFTLDPQLLEPIDGSIFHPLNWIIKSGQRELCLPKAALVMSKIAGIDIANYKIEFSGYHDPAKYTQIVKLIDQSEIDEFLQQRSSEGDPYYAKMKVDGTDTWFVWF